MLMLFDVSNELHSMRGLEEKIKQELGLPQDSYIELTLEKITVSPSFLKELKDSKDPKDILAARRLRESTSGGAVFKLEPGFLKSVSTYISIRENMGLPEDPALFLSEEAMFSHFEKETGYTREQYENGEYEENERETVTHLYESSIRIS